MKKIVAPILIILLISIFYCCEKDNNESLVVTDFDGNSYKTVQIGNKIWMAENLKATHFADGTVIPLVENGIDWNALGYTDKAMCYYDNSIMNQDTYGALYTWAAAMNGSTSSKANPSDVQGVCPDGWHLPSDDEWKELEMYIGMSQAEVDRYSFRGTNEGSKLAGGATLWVDGALEENSAFRSTDFMAIPGGYRTPYGGIFGQLGDIVNFWTATESGDTLALDRLLHFSFTEVHRFTDSKKAGHSVRCIKD